MALILGAPDTVPAGNMERKASNLLKLLAVAKEHVIGEIPRQPFPEHSRNLGRQMNDVTEFLYRHKMIDFHCIRLANPINVVSGEINKHNVFRSVLFR
jgi:hypothetical protein